MMRVNKDLARRRFSKAARAYDKWSQPQKDMADTLMGMLDPTADIETILELGCGTGLLTERLIDAYPDAMITAIDMADGMIQKCLTKWNGGGKIRFIVADAEEYLPDSRFDLIVSNSCFQWLSDLPATLRRCAQWLKPAGTLAYSAPAQGSLRELQACYSAATSGKSAGHELPSVEDYLRHTVSRLGLLRSKTTEIVYTYDSPEQVLEAVRSIGATRAVAGDGIGLTRGQLFKMLQHYQNEFSDADGRAFSAYRCVYVMAGGRS